VCVCACVCVRARMGVHAFIHSLVCVTEGGADIIAGNCCRHTCIMEAMPGCQILMIQTIWQVAKQQNMYMN
jgi:hypothetical protein